MSRIDEPRPAAVIGKDTLDGSQDGHESKVYTPAAQRALAEAAERRRLSAEAEATRPKELHGRGGVEPVRFGDWEIKGLAIDF